MPKKKKNLTNLRKMRYNGTVLARHCGRVCAFVYEGDIYVKCSECGEWIKIKHIVKA